MFVRGVQSLTNQKMANGNVVGWMVFKGETAKQRLTVEAIEDMQNTIAKEENIKNVIIWRHQRCATGWNYI